MARRTSDERRAEVLAAALARVQAARREWGGSLTLGELANDTGIDPAQLARDFGSKESLMDEVVAQWMGDNAFDEYLANNEAWLARMTDTPLSELAVEYGHYFEQMVMGDLDRIQSHLAMWATSSDGSAEWRALGRAHERVLVETGRLLVAMIDRLVANGRVRRSLLTEQEIVTLADATMEGLLIRRTMLPHLVPDGLFARALTCLLLGLIGPDDESPAVALDRPTRALPTE